MMTQSELKTTSLFFLNLLLPDGWARDVRVSIAAGLVTAIEVGTTPRDGDERVGCGLPGLPNLHSHAFQRGMAGLAERRGPTGDSFWTWRETMYRFVEQIDPDQLRAIAALAYIEMLEGGLTRVGEFHYLHNDRSGQPYADIAEMSASIAAAASESGIGLTLLPVLYSHAGFGAQPPREDQRRFIQTIDSFSRLVEGGDRAVAGLSDAIVGVSPHSLRAVTPVQLGAVQAIAGPRPIHIHIAEQVREVDDCLAWSGQRPVEWLLDHAEVDDRWCLVHATHMTEAETVGMARRGAVAGLCPITEANLGDGLFPAQTFLDAGGRYGVGSDSNVLIDATEELRLLEYGQRLAGRGRNMLAGSPGRSTGADIYAAALRGGATALGVQGGVQVGLPADIVSLNLRHPALLHRDGDAITDSYVFAAGRSAIDCVWRYGEKLVSGGRHLARERVERAYDAALEKLLA